MEKITDIALASLTLPYNFWLSVFLMIDGIYFIIIAPLLFRFWIIPKVENRYRTILKVDSSLYMSLCPNFTAPPLEMSFYMFFKCIKWEKLNGMKNPQPGRFFFELKRINYDINTASRPEKVMASITVFFFIAMVVSGIVVCMT